MKENSRTTGIVATGLEAAWENVAASFERFCLTAGIATLAEMMEHDAVARCGPRHGRTAGKLGFHGGKVAAERPRVRAQEDGAELALPNWQAAQAEDWLGRWAMNLMLINVSTRRFGRAVRLPEGDIVAPPGAGVSRSCIGVCWPKVRRIALISAFEPSTFSCAKAAKAGRENRQVVGLLR